ncbi:MAG: ABC transporter permease [Clostridia bacterium]|jgi:peptide/nickel transport system permease protein
MRTYILRRFLFMIISVLLMSFVAFVLIDLPPGDYVTMYVKQLEISGTKVTESMLESLKMQYGFGQPFHIRYLKWIAGIITKGDFGRSFQWNRPVIDLIVQRLPSTVILSLLTIMFTYLVAIPIGIYSATHQYSIGDYIATVFGFLGLAVPSFLLALVLVFFLYNNFGISPGGLFSPEYADAPWSMAKVLDFLQHMIVPVIVTGASGTAGLIRTMRATLLDELSKDYVDTARVKGLPERKLLYKYPVRVAINPILSTLGWLLPSVFSGTTIVAIVVNVPTIGPLLLQGLMSQDMYLAGSIILILTVLTLIGTFISDILLAWSDPRIRYE